MPQELTSLCVFCGSSSGTDPVYRDAAARVGTMLSEQGIRLVFGGGKVGLMGVVADACLAAGGEVIGVIPRALRKKEISHETVTKLHVVGTMHERKALMAELSDGFLCLPGGYGTFEEFCEVITWGQLGIHAKPCGLLNVNRYYDPLLAQFDHGVSEGFIRPLHRQMVLSHTNPDELLAQMRAYTPVEFSKWVDESEI